LKKGILLRDGRLEYTGVKTGCKKYAVGSWCFVYGRVSDRFKGGSVNGSEEILVLELVIQGHHIR